MASCEGPSLFEQRRNNNIERNEAFLKSLGLDDIRCAPLSYNKKQQKRREREEEEDEDEDDEDDNDAKKQHRRKVRRSSQKKNVAEPTRRSSRAMGIPAVREKSPSSAAPRRAPRLYGSDLELDISIDDDETVRRKRVSANLLREEIDQVSSVEEADVESVSNEAIQHCLMRISSMSNARLATRIKVIARAQGQHCREKLLVFHHALRLSGLDELASSCKAALDLVRG